MLTLGSQQLLPLPSRVKLLESVFNCFPVSQTISKLESEFPEHLSRIILQQFSVLVLISKLLSSIIVSEFSFNELDVIIIGVSSWSHVLPMHTKSFETWVLPEHLPTISSQHSLWVRLWIVLSVVVCCLVKLQSLSLRSTLSIQ